VNGNRNEQLISSVFGLGEGLVSGELNADVFTYNEGVIQSEIANKKHEVRHKQSLGGTEIRLLKPELSDQPSLDRTQIKEIANLLQELRKHYGKAQDIEFAYVGNQLYLLQSRAITGLDKAIDKQGTKIVWDNSNIIESYPGVSTPLTFSFIIKMYEAVYSQFALLLGIKEKELEPHQETLANMLGILNGRVYYNLKNWFKLLALLPAYSLNSGYMEKMMGVKESFTLEEGEYSQLSKSQAWLRLLSTGRKMLKSLRKLPSERKKFKAFLDKVIAEYEAIDFEAKQPHELMQLYLNFERILVKEWKAPLVNDLFAMIYFGSLEKLIKKWGVGTNPNLHNDLHCGSQDIISTEPIKRLFALTQAINENSIVLSLFKNSSPEGIWDNLTSKNSDELSSIKALIDDYIHKFGERCVGELKLETISYKQKPEVLISILKSYVEQGVTQSLTEDKLEERLRMEAETEVSTSLKGKWLKRQIFNYVLRMSRSLVSSRENLRYERTRGFGMVRSIFSAIGKQFYAEGIIEHDRDIFYLSKEEIFSYISGTAISTKLKETIALRKEEYAAYKKMDQPSDRISTFGVVYHANDFYPKAVTGEFEGDLNGIGCCPGRVKGQVRVIRDPKETNTLGGDILVTSSTDPGWVTLFPTASAILVERGSLLSHSAIVSREMGIPCVVGVDGLLANLQTGDWVEMDGSSGKIKVLKP
ncbi:MAG: PEP-utilizing enzyme, partial [Bacteroidia bacterium]|nr:PEP-utilizing enzyme [Bacteroidia bacterium]